MRGNRISDLSPLAGLADLELLSFKDTDIVDIGVLADLHQLTYLSLSGTSIVNPEPLAQLRKLKTLYLKETQLSEDQVEWLKAQLPNSTIYWP